MQALTTNDIRDLARLEQQVEDNLTGFLKAGQALAEIHERRLYRADYPSFEKYLADRWGISRARGYQLIAAVEVSTRVDIENEKQARVLAGHPVEAQREVVAQAKAEGDTSSPNMQRLLDEWNHRPRGVEEDDEDGPATGDKRAPKERARQGGDLARCSRLSYHLRQLREEFGRLTTPSTEQEERFGRWIADGDSLVDELRAAAAD